MEKTELVSKTKKRLYGLDLLKIIAMLYVVILHTLVHGGVIDAIDPQSLKYKAAVCLEILAYPAVDMFAAVLGFSAAVLILSVLIDKPRQMLFKAISSMLSGKNA